MKWIKKSLGLVGVDVAGTGTPLLSWDNVVKEFGAYLPQKGYMPNANHMNIEVTEDDEIIDDFVRSPMLEVTPNDFDYLTQKGMPYGGMLALGDNGALYEYNTFDNVFDLLGALTAPKKRPAKKAKAKAKVQKTALQQVAKTLPEGGVIVKVADKEAQVAMDLVKPILESFSYYAKKIAPVAAVFPGYGPVISQLAKLPPPGKAPKVKPQTLAKKQAALAVQKAKAKAKAKKRGKAAVEAAKKAARKRQQAREQAAKDATAALQKMLKAKAKSQEKMRSLP